MGYSIIQVLGYVRVRVHECGYVTITWPTCPAACSRPGTLAARWLHVNDCDEGEYPCGVLGDIGADTDPCMDAPLPPPLPPLTPSASISISTPGGNRSKPGCRGACSPLPSPCPLAWPLLPSWPWSVWPWPWWPWVAGCVVSAVREWGESWPIIVG